MERRSFRKKGNAEGKGGGVERIIKQGKNGKTGRGKKKRMEGGGKIYDLEERKWFPRRSLRGKTIMYK
jgi:hypothetical protein